MAAPVIDITQSVPDYDQWQAWGYQPYATNDPVSWQARGLPPGVSINTTTGLVSGASTLPGVYQFELRATNADVTSEPVTFVVGIRPAAPSPPSAAIDTIVDLDSRAVTFLGASATSGLMLKRGDDIVFQIRFVRNNVGADLAITTLEVALKDDETGEPIVTGNTFAKFGSGADTVYRLYAKIAVSDDAFNDPEDDTSDDMFKRSALLKVIGEFELLETNAFGVGPADVRSSTQSWAALLIRDLVANPA